MAPNWDDLQAVLAVVRGGSLAAAAQALDVNYTTVARRVARASDATGTQLFERLPEGYCPTDAGRLVARHAAEMETAAHTLGRQLLGQDETLTGPLTITAPQLLIAQVLGPLLSDFAKAHPRIDIHLRATNDLLDLTRREADLALRVSRSPGDTLMGQELTPQDNAAFAAQVWLDRWRADAAAPLDWLVYEAYPDVPKAARAAAPGSRVLMRFDDMSAMAGAAQAGLGIVRMPMFLGRTLPGLVHLPILPPKSYAPIWIVGHPDVWPSAKVAAFRSRARAFFRAKRAQFIA